VLLTLFELLLEELDLSRQLLTVNLAETQLVSQISHRATILVELVDGSIVFCSCNLPGLSGLNILEE
jgi:hypothetical protein